MNLRELRRRYRRASRRQGYEKRYRAWLALSRFVDAADARRRRAHEAQDNPPLAKSA